MLRLINAILTGWTILFHFAGSVLGQHPQATVVIGNPQATTTPGRLDSPFGVDFDADGNMYIVELSGGRVHKLDSAGQLKTIAGDGSEGFLGDGGPATDATFNGMHNVAVTPDGDLYIADSWNHCVRKIDTELGLISTFAGTGEAGFSGDGGPATEATFNFLMCVSLNPANDKLYLADLKNLRIRMVDLTSGIVSTVAGNGNKEVPSDRELAIESPLVDPRAVAVDSSGNIYVLERGGHALRLVTSDGRIRTVVGTGEPGDADGAASKAQLRSPKHLAIDHHDNVIIADEANQRICRYDPREQMLTTILGRGVEIPNCDLLMPHGVCVHPDGSIFVVDTGHHRIIKLHR